MTSTRSATSATTPMSCVMNMTAMCISSCNCRMSSRICAWIVTSSAVVGSSAISSRGWHESAIAIITRWRMPPESWCGWRSSTWAASGMRTCSSMRSASRFAAAKSLPWCSRIDSAICSPIVNTGLSDVIGSWKIIAISAPRMARIVAESARARSMRSPFARSNSSRPAVMRPPPCSTSRISDSAVTDLPDPDSPTMATVSPRPTVNDTPRTAATTRSVVRNSTARPATASSAVEAEGEVIGVNGPSRDSGALSWRRRGRTT